MWAAEWEALRAGAVQLEDVGRIWLALGVIAVLAALALLRGPALIRVPDAGGRGERRLWLDGPWLLSLTLRLGALGLIGLTLARPTGLVPQNPAAGRGIDLVIALDASGSMQALDAINRNHPFSPLHFAATGIRRPWQAKFNHRSARYTTRFDELLEVKAVN